jgi:hypothetical protein
MCMRMTPGAQMMHADQPIPASQVAYHVDVQLWSLQACGGKHGARLGAEASKLEDNGNHLHFEVMGGRLFG